MLVKSNEPVRGRIAFLIYLVIKPAIQDPKKK